MEKEASDYQTWVVEQLGGMLGSATDLSPIPENEKVSEIVTACIQKLTKGKARVFAQKVTESKSNLAHWVRKGRRPTIGVLLALCYNAELSLKDFFNGASPLYAPAEKIQRLSKDLWHCFSPEELDEMETRLRPMLTEDPPPCKAEAARRIGCDPFTLKQHFPELLSTLNERYGVCRKNVYDKDKCLSALRAAQEERPPPSVAEISRRLGCSVAYLKLHFRDECRVISDKHDALRMKFFYSDGLEEQLRQFLNRNPPPTLTACASEIGCCVGTLRRLFPSIGDEIVRRYAESRREDTEQRRSEHRHKAIEVIESLRAQGIKPTSKLVRRLLPGMFYYSLDIRRLLQELEQ